MKDYKYIHFEKFILRTPFYPISVIKRGLVDASFYSSILSSESFRTAMFFTSPDLFDALVNYVDGKMSIPESQKVEIAIYKYLSRMSTRCTPFSMLANCSVGCVSGRNEIVISNNVRKLFRFDMQFLCALFHTIQLDWNIRAKMKYKINSSIYVVGGNIRYINYISMMNHRVFKIEEVKKTQLLTTVLKIAKESIPFDSLVEQILYRSLIPQLYSPAWFFL